MVKTTVGKTISNNLRDVVLDGVHAGFFRKEMEPSIGSKGVSKIIKAGASVVENLNDPNIESAPEKIGLLFGRIQSGKTNSYTGTIALAADNGFKCFIVLTSDNLWLYNQTRSRLLKGLPGLSILGKDDWENSIGSISTKFSRNGVVFLSTKNSTILDKLIDVLTRCGAAKYAALIIDDEADQASLNTHASKAKKDDTSQINAAITSIRSLFKNKGFIQVTATPQALFLQGIEHPYRPGFTILTEPGEGYVGGETFFGKTSNQHLIKYVADKEIDSLVTSKVKSASKTIPDGLKQALCTFYVAATIKELKGKGEHFSFLCHVSLKKADHDHIRELIRRFIDKVEKGLFENNDDIKKLFKKEYDELVPYVDAPPSFDEVINKMSFFITSTEIQVLNTDSKTISEPKYDCRYNILIGGNKLGRGVTIERLLVTYYGRQAKRPQMDTVLQHARMYGYRSADLDVSRIYLSSQLAERFKMIYESEEALREIINKYQNEGYRGIWLEKKVAPTRSNVLDPNELGVFAAGKTYFPHKPVYQKKKVADLTDKLDKLLEDYKSAPKTKAVTVDMDFIIDLISHTKCEKDSPGVWNDQRIITALETLKKEHQYAYLLVRKDRELARQETSEGLGAVYQSSELELAPTNLPTLIMLRQNGKISKKWDGQPFWIPAVRFPDGNYAIMFNLSEV